MRRAGVEAVPATPIRRKATCSLSGMKGRLAAPACGRCSGVTALIYGQGMGREGCACDRRAFFSGATRGMCIGYVSPESLPSAGPLALVRQGDRISHRLRPPRRMDVLIDDGEFWRGAARPGPSRRPGIAPAPWPNTRVWVGQAPGGAVTHQGAAGMAVGSTGTDKPATKALRTAATAGRTHATTCRQKHLNR